MKRYFVEDGTETVDELIEDERTVVSSSLSVIETASAFRRKVNRGELSEGEMNGLLGDYFREALDDFLIVPLEASALQFSFDLVLEADLRTLDSLQLSAALAIDTDETPVVFVCTDRELVATASTSGRPGRFDVDRLGR